MQCIRDISIDVKSQKKGSLERLMKVNCEVSNNAPLTFDIHVIDKNIDVNCQLRRAH